jgi:hypothetical protein
MLINYLIHDLEQKKLIGYQRLWEHTAPIFRRSISLRNTGCLPTSPQGVTTQMISIDIFTAVRTSKCATMPHLFIRAINYDQELWGMKINNKNTGNTCTPLSTGFHSHTVIYRCICNRNANGRELCPVMEVYPDQVWLPWSVPQNSETIMVMYLTVTSYITPLVSNSLMK